VALK
jgi:hypothetical protein